MLPTWASMTNISAPQPPNIISESNVWSKKSIWPGKSQIWNCIKELVDISTIAITEWNFYIQKRHWRYKLKKLIWRNNYSHASFILISQLSALLKNCNLFKLSRKGPNTFNRLKTILPSFTIFGVLSRNSVSLGDIFVNTTFWMDDFPLLKEQQIIPHY